MTALELAVAKLAESGLTLDDAARLGIDVLEAAQVEPLLGVSMPALHFTYYGIDGAPIADMYRLRVLGPPPVVAGGFGQVAAPPRYWQPPGSMVKVYFPRNVARSWAEIAADPGAPLILTEGELKASAAAKAGLTTIAFGGVWSWCHRKLGNTFLTDLEAIVWAHRQVTIAFDSDAMRNHNVAAAIAALGTQLRDRGADVSIACLPEIVEGRKCGLDDFLVGRGIDALKEVLNAAPSFDDLTRELLRLNARFIYVAKPGKVIYDAQADELIRSDVWVELYGNIKATKLVPGPPPTGQKLVSVVAAKEWLAWPSRRTYAEMVYEPGEPKLLNGVPGHYRVNRWAGWGCEPLIGDVLPWTALLDHLFRGAEPGAREWFERWCAFPLQHPGVKMTSAVGIWSREQGQGKSLIGVTLGMIYGRNYILIGEKQLEDDFNHWADSRQFVLVDDITGQDTRDRADLLKKLITQTENVINIKFMPQYVQRDCVNYYMTSNRPNSFFIEREDRRFFIHEVKVGRLEPDFYELYHAWLRDGGPRALFAHLLALPLGDFSPYVPPPLTAAKLAMIESVRSDQETWICELREAPEAKLRIGEQLLTRDLFTARELLAYYQQDCAGRPPSLSSFSNALGGHFKQVNGGGPVRVGSRLLRLWIVRNDERWLRATPAEIAAHVIETSKLEGGGAGY